MRAIWPLVLFLLLTIGFAIGLTKDPKILPSEVINQPFPEFSLSDLYTPEKIYTNSDLVGEVTLINVFGSWCVACIQEHSMLVELQNRDDIQIVGINWRDERDKAERWLERYQNPYSKIIFDDESLLAIELGVTGAPESFLTDKSGYIRYKHIGIITRDVWDNTLLPLIKSFQDEAKSPS